VVSCEASATAPPAGLPLSELAARQGRSEEGALELLRPFLDAGIVAERSGRLVVVDELVSAAFGPEEPREPGPEEPLAARVTAYLERHRSNPARRRVTHIAEAVRGDKARLRALLREAPEYVNVGTKHVQCWALASWADEVRAA
jgi:hypothetical protein